MNKVLSYKSIHCEKNEKISLVVSASLEVFKSEQKVIYSVMALNICQYFCFPIQIPKALKLRYLYLKCKIKI